MHKKFELNWTKIKGGYHSYTKAAPQQSYNDLTLKTCSFGYSIVSVNRVGGNKHAGTKYYCLSTHFFFYCYTVSN